MEEKETLDTNSLMNDDKSQESSQDKEVDYKKEEREAILNFILKLQKLLPIETLKSFYRITPQGLFVAQKETNNLVSLFAKDSDILENKAFKKLFEEESLDVYYLLEGKNCLTGNLVPLEIKEPQKFKLPYYLGSLTNARTYLHPLDPEINNFKEFSIKGNVISFKKGEYTYTFSQDLLKDFNRFIDFSSKISKEFPEASKSLQQSLKVFIRLFKRAKFVHRMQNFLIPSMCFGNKTYKFVELGMLKFVFDKENKIVSFYEVMGKNLYYFMRKEFEKIKSSYNSAKTGTFKTLPAKNKSLGFYTMNQREYFLHPYAFLNFLERAPEMKSMENYFGKVYTVEKAFEEFSYLFINATPIEPKKIQNYLDYMKKYSSKYLINQQWIFGLDSRSTITACISKKVGK